MSEWIKLCGLWKNTTKEGKPYLAGYIGGAKMMIFQNSQKEGEKDFDYHVFLAEAPKKKKPGESPPASAPAQVQQTENEVPF